MQEPAEDPAGPAPGSSRGPKSKFMSFMKEAFKEELLHFAECVQTGTKPFTTLEEAKGDVTLLHRIFMAIKRPLK